jgi:hypothetical protein
VTSDSAIQATVPAGARTGPVSVTTSAGTAASKNNFIVWAMLSARKAGTGSGFVSSISDRSPVSPSQIGCGNICDGYYELGTVVTLTATPDTGSNFTRWDGCDTVSGATCTVTMNAARSVTATFTVQTFSLNVTKSGLLTTGSVTSTSNPASTNQIDCGSTCSATYNYGTVVTLTAQAGLLALFTGWSGCDSSSGNTCTVTMTAAKSVTASFLP